MSVGSPDGVVGRRRLEVLAAGAAVVANGIVLAAPLAVFPPSLVTSGFVVRFLVFYVAATALVLADQLAEPDRAGDGQDVGLACGTGLALLAVFWTSLTEDAFAMPDRAGGLVPFLGLVLMMAGAVMRACAVLALGSGFVSDRHPDAGRPLATSGLHAVLRHPSEAGTLACGLGASLLFGSPSGFAVFAVLLVPLVLVRVRREDRALEAAYGDAFRAYAAVTGALVPWVAPRPDTSPDEVEPGYWSRRRWASAPSAVDVLVSGAIFAGAFELGAWLVLLIPAAWAFRRYGRTNRVGLVAWSLAWLTVVVLLTMIVPACEDIYRDIGLDLPVSTAMLLEAARLATVQPLASTLALIGGFASAGLIARSRARPDVLIVSDAVPIVLAGALVIGAVVGLCLPLVVTVETLG